MTKRKTDFRPGDEVVLISTGECGVVVSAWHEAEAFGHDHYVAFFGARFPAPGTKPRKPPYVLRCSETSLRAAVTGDRTPARTSRAARGGPAREVARRRTR
jgi:hypothetical protein